MQTPNRNKNTCTVLVGGCFDVLHFGHISFLKTAKSYGDILIVALESDKNVAQRKGKKRPIHSQKQRAAMLSELRCVDSVITLPYMKSDADYDAFVQSINPNIIATTKGDPLKNNKQRQAKQVGAVLIEIPKITTPSTSQLAKLIGLE